MVIFRKTLWQRTVLFVVTGMVLNSFLQVPGHLNFRQSSLVFFMGWFFWSLFEYLFHRFIEHIKIPLLDEWHGHLQHHKHPQHPAFAFFPIRDILFILTGVFLFFLMLTQHLYLAFMLCNGFILGYLHYEWVHYAVHYTQPKNKVMKWVVNNHLLHHVENPRAFFGFITPFWDVLFRTNSRAEKI